jgi:hypothetical protein
MAVGPHEGRELDLMLTRAKPLAMFVDSIPPEYEGHPEEEFDSVVADGKLVKSVSVSAFKDAGGKERQTRRVLYALPEEAWRIPAMELVQKLYDSLLPGWRPDLERVIGLLLGYAEMDIEDFLNHLHRSQ